MKQKLLTYLVKAPLLSLLIWFISHSAMMICYMTAQIGGIIFYPIFMFISSWPLILIKAVNTDLHGQLLHPNDDYSNTYIRGQKVCIIGWIIISPIVFKLVKVIREKRKREKLTNKVRFSLPES